MAEWYRHSPEEIARQFETDIAAGLAPAEAQTRLGRYGANELIDKGVKSIWLILLEQLTDAMVFILIVAAIVSAFIGEAQDTIVILAIVLINAALGVSQEYRAEQAIAALKKLAVPTVRVRRDGQVVEISARELVPGDVVELEAGNLIPADGRLVEVANLRIEEAALTGESEPIEKKIDPIDQEQVALGDRKNSAFMGTVVTYGRGSLLITETGMRTELGKIANLIQGVEAEKTPLQERLDGLGKALAWIALGIIAAVFFLGLTTSSEVAELWASGAGAADYLRSHDVRELFLTAISMAVAAVPEGLPAVVTVTLALGSQRLLRRNALIRKLPAVETLGSVSVICSDKTGTLTENRMTVTLLDVAGERERVEMLAEKSVELAYAERRGDADPPLRSLAILLKAVAHCNDGKITVDEDGSIKAVGDPTETALIVAADRFGIRKNEIDQECPRVGEIPFTSERKRMTTIHQVNEATGGSNSPWSPAPYVAFVKGAVDGLLDISSHVWIGEQAVALDDEWRERIEASNAELAGQGHRVLGAAFRPLDRIPSQQEIEDTENNLTFVGFAGMIDPPREEVAAAVQECRTAGIRPIMITGDHPLTAQFIARELDITRNDRVMTGYKLNNLAAGELEEIVGDVSVFARVAPEHKLNIVEALQGKGLVVAMTGDGVNDAPALKRADIGVAMGITGTDVSKEASDMVLLDDNFATIVAAVKEGRTIYDNIRKFIKYTLSSNIGELLVMLAAPFLGMPLPLIPIQILWINLVTDGVPGLALAVEKEERGTMERPPYKSNESVFSRGLGAQIIFTGVMLGLVSLAVGYWGFLSGRDIAVWRTMTFTTLTIAQMGNALATRSFRDTLPVIGFWSNRLMVAAIVSTFVLQLMLIYIPFLQDIFSTVALSGVELAACFVVSGLVYALVELMKLLKPKFLLGPAF